MDTTKPSALGAVHIGVAWTLYVVAISVVFLRFLCRRRLRQKIFVDDWLILSAVFFALVMVIEVSLWSQGGGFGYSSVSLAKPQRKEFFVILFAQRITYWILSPWAKISILLFYRRHFSTHNFFRHATIIIGFLVVSASIVGTITFTYHYVYARSHQATIASVLQNKQLLRYVLGAAATNFILDCIILCMPLPLIWSLNLSVGKKWSVSGVFLVGGLTCIAGGMRIVFIYGIHHHDYQYALEGPACIWMTVEGLMSIISACLPTLRPLILWYKSRKDTQAQALATQAPVPYDRYLSMNSTVMSVASFSQSPQEQQKQRNMSLAAMLMQDGVALEVIDLETGRKERSMSESTAQASSSCNSDGTLVEYEERRIAKLRDPR